MSNNEKRLLQELFEVYQGLKELGWIPAVHCPANGKPIQVIELGSAGIHEGYRDEIGFWVSDDEELCPSEAILYKPLQK